MTAGTETEGRLSNERQQRTIDAESLKALSHPLRVQLYDILSQYGPATASGLAERLGESSGATSYHLRQLEKHGFVRELKGHGTARERWWERTPGGVELNRRTWEDSPAMRAAAGTVLRQWHAGREALLQDFVTHGLDVVGPEWYDASLSTTVNLRLTVEQLTELRDEWLRCSQPLFERFRGQNLPGSRPVQLHMNAFPLVDGEETPQ